METSKDYIPTLVRTSKIIFFGILIQASLFVFWGASFFIQIDAPPSPGLPAFILFAILGVLSFFYGLRFFQNYTHHKKKQMMDLPPDKRKESLLLVVAVHLLVLEFVCILGILLAIFTQKAWAMYPFYGAFLIGLYFSYPKADWFISFYTETNG